MQFLQENKQKFFTDKSDAQDNMILNYALNLLFNTQNITYELACSVLDLYYKNKNINECRKKYILSKVMPIYTNEFVNIASIDHNNIGLNIRTSELLFKFKNDFGAKILYDNFHLAIQQKAQKPHFASLVPQKPKVALIITGMIRGDDTAFKLMQENFIKPLNADVFCHTWDRFQLFSGAEGNAWWAGRCFPKITKFLPADINVTSKLQKLFPNFCKAVTTPIYASNTKDRIPKFINFKKCAIENEEHFVESLGDDKKNFMHNNGTFNQAKMFYGMYKGICLMQEYEKDNNFYYDYIIRIRPDYCMNTTCTYEILQELSNNEIAVHCGCYGPNDGFFYGNRENVIKMMSVFKLSQQTRSLNPFKNYDYRSHALLHCWIIYNNLSCVPVKIQSIGGIQEVLANVKIDKLVDVRLALQKDFAKNKLNKNEAYKKFFDAFFDEYCSKDLPLKALKNPLNNEIKKLKASRHLTYQFGLAIKECRQNPLKIFTLPFVILALKISFKLNKKYENFTNSFKDENAIKRSKSYKNGANLMHKKFFKIFKKS